MTEKHTEQTREALKAGIAAGTHDLIEQAQALTAEVRKERRQSRVLTWIALGVALLMLLIAAGVGYEFYRLNTVADQNRQNGAAIRSCTTPGGKCYEQSQAQTEVALGRLMVGFCAGLFPNDPASAQRCAVAAVKALRTP